MKQFPLWFAAAALAVIPLEDGVFAQEPVPVAAEAPKTTPSSESVSLENLSDQFARLDEELKAAVATLRKLVDTEVTAGRLTEVAASHLRMNLRSADSASSGSDLRGLLSVSRVPADNQALTSAFSSLESNWTSIQNRRADLQKAALATAIRRSTELVEKGKTAEEVAPLLTSLGAAAEVLQRRMAFSGSEGSQTLQNLSNQLQNFQRFLEAQSSGDTVKLSQAVAALQQNSQYNRTALDEKIRTRIDKDLKPLTLAMDAAQDALDAGIEAGKSGEELITLLGRFEDAAEKVPAVGNRENRQVVSNYRAIVAALSRAGQDGGSIKQAIRSATEYVSSIGSKRSAALRAALQKRERQIEETAEKMAKEQAEQWRTRLATVKDAAALNQLAVDIQSAPVINREDRSGGSESNAALARTLSALASSWSAGNLAFLIQSSGESGYPRVAYVVELDALRKKIERDILARTLKSPELNQPPLADQETAAAIEALSADLFKRQEWRRLLQLVEARQLLQSSRAYGMGMREGDLSGALRAFISGGNFETAEQWEEAVNAYRTVLRSTDEKAPVQAAADRLKDLKAKHADAFKSPAPLPDARIVPPQF